MNQENKLYNIVRFFHSGRKRKIHKNVSLTVAQLHCRDPRTRKSGVWFDGYEEVRA
jgi:hypothetical protein